MAESDLSQSVNDSPSSTELIIPTLLKFLMTNLKSVAAVSLTSNNYSIWSSQVLKLFRANGFHGFLTGSSVCPSKHSTHSDGTVSINPHYTHWTMLDQNLSAALLSTISTTILPYILNLTTTAEIWDTLLKRLQATNRSRVIQLKNELHNLSLKTNTMTQFLTEVKTTVDQISAAGSKVDTEDIILYILNGLPSQYQPFKTAIRTREAPLSLDELYSLLLSEEINLSMENAKQTAAAQMTLYSNTSKGRGSYSRARGHGQFIGGRNSAQSSNSRG